jgi:RNA polymerase sigma factor (sigma-70 family)
MDTVATLLANRTAFLRYLESRVGDAALAEDILQDAFVKVAARPESAPADEGVVPWFYRTLKHAAIDQFRRRASASRALDAFSRELAAHQAPPDELAGEICGCVSRLASTLKPEYRDAVLRVDVGGAAVKDFAAEAGISPGNAAVRLFRARTALKKRVAESCGACATHGCLNCTCNDSRVSALRGQGAR